MREPKPKKRKYKSKSRKKIDARLKGATGEDKDRILFSFYCSLDQELSHAARCEFVAVEFGLTSSNAVRIHGSRHRWPERYVLYLEEYQLKQKEMKLQLRNPETGVTVEVAASELAKDVKGAVKDSLKASRLILKTNTELIGYYAALIQNKITAKGGVQNLLPFDLTEIDIWTGKIWAYQSRISDFLKPSAVSTLLKMVGMDYLGDAEDSDNGPMTLAALQERVLQFGFKSAFEDKERTEAVFAQYEVDGLPDIEGVE